MFHNANGADIAAKRLKRRFSITMSQARQIVAIIAGYRDWHHLTHAIGTARAPKKLGTASDVSRYTRKQEILHNMEFERLVEAVRPKAASSVAEPVQDIAAIDISKWPQIEPEARFVTAELWPDFLTEDQIAEITAGMADLANATLDPSMRAKTSQQSPNGQESECRLVTADRSFQLRFTHYGVDDPTKHVDSEFEIRWTAADRTYSIKMDGDGAIEHQTFKNPLENIKEVSGRFGQMLNDPREHPEELTRLMRAILIKATLDEDHAYSEHFRVDPLDGRVTIYSEENDEWTTTTVATPRRFQILKGDGSTSLIALRMEMTRLYEWVDACVDYDAWAEYTFAEAQRVLAEINAVLKAANLHPIPAKDVETALNRQQHTLLSNLIYPTDLDLDDILFDFIASKGLQDEARAYVAERAAAAPRSTF